ncbi:MAG: NAD(P)-dependent oxidoreductase [Acidimicrobiales bacterium]
MFGRLLEAAKRFPDLAAAQLERRWDPTFGDQLAGRTIGLIGLGAINQAVASRAHAFGMRVLAVRRSTGAERPPHIDRVYGPSELHDMLGRCDAVVAAVPETPETVGMMGAAAFAAMRPGAFFANVGRGTLVDEAALLAALESGQLGSAALDVTRVEPLPVDDPLWTAPNLRISAHCSTSPTAMLPNVYRVFRANLERFVQGEPLAGQVSANRGY